MAKFSLKDHLFNEGSLSDLAAEFAAGVPDFDAAGFKADALAGLFTRFRELWQCATGWNNIATGPLDLLYAATQRFSMECYIRPFLNRWPEQVLARLSDWARGDNYHVRRLVSE